MSPEIGFALPPQEPVSSRAVSPAVSGAVAFCVIWVCFLLLMLEVPLVHAQKQLQLNPVVIKVASVHTAQAAVVQAVTDSSITSPSMNKHAAVATNSANSQSLTPRLAIVIDDWGTPSEYAAEFLALGVPITAAVIPYQPASTSHATHAAAAGFDVLLHLPMEPENAHLRLKGMVTEQMSDQEIATVVQAALATLPEVVGVNNHMGSRATANERVMQATLTVVKQAGLLFLDSRTSSKSKGAAVAQSMGIPTLENAAFLDVEADTSYIRERLLHAARLAKERGTAVAIGHVRPATLRALRDTLPELERLGIQLVRVSELVGME